MRCEDVAEQLTELMEGSLPADVEASALEHLASCDSCERVLAETELVVRLTHDHGRLEVDDDDRHRLFGAISAEVRARGTGTTP